MKRYFLALLILCGFVHAQSDFSVEAYNQFLQSNKDLTYEQLSRVHPAGLFEKTARKNLDNVAYFDSVAIKLNLTEAEKNLLQKNGFLVTERLQPHNFVFGLTDVYDKELPVFISTDAILYTLHKSYDAILKHFEEGILISKVQGIITGLHDQLPALHEKYSSDSLILKALKDLDIYLTVPQRMFYSVAQPYYEENLSDVKSLLGLIQTLQPAPFKLFANTERTIDFSQFQPRGHYTDSNELKIYFKMMMWLGRIEIYLITPQSEDAAFSKEDIQRQNILAALLNEALQQSGIREDWELVEDILLHFIGESDNITVNQLQEAFTISGLKNAEYFSDLANIEVFQNILTEQFETSQKINSHILMSDPMSPEQIKPATAFLLFGQRFVIDSYVTGNVVYDRILFEGKKVKRMLPSSLDVLFALGNDAALQLLDEEMVDYPYGSNLAASRYLVESYDDTFWNSSLYNSWLNAIRTLAPPADRENLPAFMQTAAWWQEKMNTQLAAWAQLRHDNLLYAKQSYSGGITCFYPEGFVEPFPDFYRAVAQYAENAQYITSFLDDQTKAITAEFFSHVSSVMDTLANISEKELSQMLLSESEQLFLKRTLHYQLVCGINYDGWFPKLFWNIDDEISEEKDIIVADVHTAPTDENGAPIGWVMHAGTGPVNMAVIITDRATGGDMAFVGPVLSYYEHVTTNFKRLTDEEWKEIYNTAPSFRPDFVNAYLADENGEALADGSMLLTGLNEDKVVSDIIPETTILTRNYPNPFNGTTVIAFSVPKKLAFKTVELSVYDVRGRLLKTILKESLPSGHYMSRWESGNAASGIYFYHLSIAGVHKTGKMLLTK
ncbi:MAG: DUF3160 domain-containing protein [Calditrichaeota bacterium]|nr:DUF3160 domain-containing protein [Calditrichota bacterium]